MSKPLPQKKDVFMIETSVKSPRRMRLYTQECDRHSYLAELQNSSALGPNSHVSAKPDMAAEAKKRAKTPSAMFRTSKKDTGRDSYLTDLQHQQREPTISHTDLSKQRISNQSSIAFRTKDNSRDSYIQDLMGVDAVREQRKKEKDDAAAAAVAADDDGGDEKKKKKATAGAPDTRRPFADPKSTLINKSKMRLYAKECSRDSYMLDLKKSSFADKGPACPKPDMAAEAQKRAKTPSSMFRISKYDTGRDSYIKAEPKRMDVLVTYRELQK